jgi:hypothetical protein
MRTGALIGVGITGLVVFMLANRPHPWAIGICKLVIKLRAPACTIERQMTVTNGVTGVNAADRVAATPAFGLWARAR